MSKNDDEAKNRTRVEGREQVGGNFGSSASRPGNSFVSPTGKSIRSVANFPRKSSSRLYRKSAVLRPRSVPISRKARVGIPTPISGASWKSRMVRSWKSSQSSLSPWTRITFRKSSSTQSLTRPISLLEKS
jgi:hypothetical protein